MNPYVVRVPALPATAPDVVGSASAASAVERRAATAEELRLSGGRCSDALHGLIGAQAAHPDRRVLLDLRRAIHNRRAARVRRLWSGVGGRLPGAVADEVRYWLAVHARLEAAVEDGQRVWTDELRRSSAAVVELAGLPPVKVELQRAGSPLAAVLDGRAGPADVDAVLSLYAFVARGSVKSTPRGALCGWARGVFHDGPDRWAGDLTRRVDHVELNATITEVLVRQLGPVDRVTANPSTTFGEFVRFVPHGHAGVRQLRLDEPVRRVLGTWLGHPRDVAAAVDDLAAVLGDVPRARGLLDSLVRADLVVAAGAVGAQGDDPVRAVLGSHRATPVSAALGEVADLVDSAMRPDTGAAAVERLPEALSGLGRRLGWPADALSRGTATFADSVLRDGRLELDAGWRQVEPTLRAIGNWIGHADPWEPVRAVVAHHLAERHGEGTPVPLVDVLHDLATARGTPGLDALWSDGFLLPDASAAGLGGLRELIAAAPVGPDGITLDALPPAPDPGPSATTSLAFYGHPVRVAGRRLFVVNSVEDGSGRPAAHVRRILRRLGLPAEEVAGWPDDRPVTRPGTLDVEISAVSGSNVNLRELGALPELNLAGPAVGGRGVDARDCRVVSRAGRLLLTHRGRPVRIVPRGRMAEFRGPAVIRVLLRAFAPPAEHRVQPVVAAAGEVVGDGAVVTPRVRIGDVVLLRRTVIVDAADVPGRGAGEDLFPYGVRVAEWCGRLEIPRQVYVRVVGSTVADKHRKPLPLDLSSPLGVLQLDKLTRKGARRLLFHEVLPTSAQVPADAHGTPWVPEVVWEVGLGDG
ncbi:lantibiotic dehydratase [Actinosynnema sp. NPDC047251]|uniref:Lantibiotic dehydratase domain-containing protein n=1 Tax=Saccharothrix espanaensis (strain ATCC 51144 / DSM 44229 / JCM 9112 / NBRC 15066 / NRRL 15764) TaxID=1179773 RepID=K0K702_SACES|nr:lantibiotic dehydratase [Saccharothrix espanaensis]CCH32674.1 Lantibiotic dehydratase domain-containing protein [Saccharothrix espanaensis DSM 44229]